ncbi:hypothetical protein AMELA_G00103760 [Ameiurus melas]|uniref:Uncharacterized protein n=1 Tax=Ameiurus melas TaxID=219545 RepID=A0A7J6AUC9_AMEME|nr:hypothetical protein AMELA_G00103760 [Ameiurus melas]
MLWNIFQVDKPKTFCVTELLRRDGLGWFCLFHTFLNSHWTFSPSSQIANHLQALCIIALQRFCILRFFC